MTTQRNIGKIIGSLFILQMIIGLPIQFGVFSSLWAKPGVLINGAEMSFLVGSTVIPSLILSGFNILIACICFKFFNKNNPILAIFYVAIATLSLAFTGVELSNVMEMISYSQQYVSATSTEVKTMLETMSFITIKGRNWSHMMNVTVSGFSMLIFYILLLRGSQVPKALLGTAIVAVICQQFAATQPFFGNSVPLMMLAPMATMQLVMGLYFIFKGIKTKSE